MYRILALMLLSGCSHVAFEERMRAEVDQANSRIKATVASECDMTKTTEPKGFTVPEPGYRNTGLRFPCKGKDGSDKVIWFDSMGNVDRSVTYR